MKRILPIFLALLLLAGCGTDSAAETTAAAEAPSAEAPAIEYAPLVAADASSLPYTSRFDSETAIVLSDDGITVNGGEETDAVYTSHDIVYYEDRDTYDSGNPYVEGTDADKHTAEEADAHTVVNITAPGAYRISGKLSAGQIRVDLGDAAYEDPDAVVELILDGADITCTVAPAIVFQNVYECDGNWDADNASSEVDTSAAGAVLVLENENTVTGSYVAKIFKDTDGEKKLWKQDGAIYSYMSMNVEGTGSLDLTAENEGLDTELHLTINGGNIAIRSGNDGINTNEDGVSVTTINAGSLHIIAGLGDEGDGIDSNGYLVINGGVVVSSANPAADAGLDSDLGSYINGGTVIALGSTMDWAESDSNQVTMNLQFAQYQTSGSAVVVTRQDGTVIFAYDPSEDEVLGENTRQYQGAVISSPNFQVGESYNVYLDGTVTGTDDGGMYDVTTVSAFSDGTQMMYTGTDVGMFGPGGMGGGFGGGQRPDGMTEGEVPELPEGETMPADWQPSDGTRPDDFDRERPEGFDGEMPTMPEGETMPEGFEGRGDRGQKGDGEMPELPEGETMPADFDPSEMGQMPDTQGQSSANDSTLFYMSDKVNAFSGITAVE
ncbi:MAG: carbohydrate-binding domain-containing protein [Oscillospiraceae bacterium]|nr:carbohydrate-binding domain-containing protein [Oscillospiraceae bacterium]